MAYEVDFRAKNLFRLKLSSVYLFRLRRYRYMLYYEFHVSDSLFVRFYII
jgi:hypothetical protein